MSSIITSALSPQRPTPPKRSRRKRFTVIGLLIYTLLGFFVAPAIIKWQLHEQLPVYTHRHAVVKQVRVNPFALSLTVRGLSLTETNGTPFAGFDELYVNFQLSSLFRWAWAFSEIKVAGPTANVTRFADGQFNFADLLTNNATSDKPFTLPPALIQQLNVTNALLTFTDHTTPTPFHTVYGPAHVELKNLSTRPDEHGPYSILAKTEDGESFAWSGTVALNPPQSRGEFKLLNIPPAKYGPYLAHFTTMRVARGTLDVSAAYFIRIAGFPPELEVSNAAVHLRDFQLKAPVADEALLTVDDFQVKEASANLTNATVRVPLVIQKGGSAFIRREAGGRLEVEKFVHAPTNGFVLIRQLAVDLQAVIKAEFRASLDELRVEDFAVTVEDQSLPTTAKLGLDHINISVKGVSNQTNAPMSVNWDANWRGGGQVQGTSTGTLLPLASQANVVVSNFALTPLQPYVESQANLIVQSGALNVNGTAQFDPANTKTPLLQFKGDVSVTNFLTSDPIADHEFVRWEKLGVQGIQFELLPNRLAVEEVKLTGLNASLVINSNGQINALELVKEKPAAVVTEPSTNPLAISLKSFPIKVGAVVFERGSLDATDKSFVSHFNTKIEEFNGRVRDITFPGLTRATIDIQGKVNAQSSFTVAGTLTPDLTNPLADLRITTTNTDLTPFTPYSEKFAGYTLNKGKLAFDVHYHIENRKVIGENAVAVDQLTFGARSESPHATKLPVKLGVALLKDNNGRIALDVPVSGNLDDPSFRLSKVVWQAVISILAKAATSPFSLLGALVGGGGEEMQYVDFDPGLAVLNDSQTNKLGKLTKALYERPGLNLEISATYDAERDTTALGRQKVLEKMKTQRIQEIVARGGPAPPLAEVTLEDNEYERLLRKAYRETFNTTPEVALREALTGVTNAPGSGPSAAAASSASMGQGKGAMALMQKDKSLSELQQQAQSGAVRESSKPKTDRELVLDELERRLMTTVPVTEDELIALMQRRIETVQKFLAGAGVVAADRLFPLTPKGGDAAKGEARAVFFLN